MSTSLPACETSRLAVCALGSCKIADSRYRHITNHEDEVHVCEWIKLWSVGYLTNACRYAAGDATCEIAI